jgi:hypothetical protein
MTLISCSCINQGESEGIMGEKVRELWESFTGENLKTRTATSTNIQYTQIPIELVLIVC